MMKPVNKRFLKKLLLLIQNGVTVVFPSVVFPTTCVKLDKVREIGRSGSRTRPAISKTETRNEVVGMFAILCLPSPSAFVVYAGPTCHIGDLSIPRVRKPGGRLYAILYLGSPSASLPAPAHSRHINDPHDHLSPLIQQWSRAFIPFGRACSASSTCPLLPLMIDDVQVPGDKFVLQTRAVGDHDLVPLVGDNDAGPGETNALTE